MRDENCTILEDICFKDSNLSRAEFAGIEIVISYFTGADLKDTEFINVYFDGVVFSKEHEMEADLDKKSEDILQEVRRNKLDLDDKDEIPCSEEW